MDYLKFYSLEEYLFGEVRNDFLKRGYLYPAEFFCIVIWKANRAKTAIKRKLLKFDRNLSSAVKKMTREIHFASTNEDKLRFMLERWGFSLPMATAVLTVLYPNDFSVYDVRVREQLGIKDFSGRKDQITKYFSEFLPKVRKSTGKSLREKDKYLWGKSFYEDLQRFLYRGRAKRRG